MYVQEGSVKLTVVNESGKLDGEEIASHPLAAR
jgi:hypothetical protein